MELQWELVKKDNLDEYNAISLFFNKEEKYYIVDFEINSMDHPSVLIYFDTYKEADQVYDSILNSRKVY